jgi:hypothetical protein
MSTIQHTYTPDTCQQEQRGKRDHRPFTVARRMSMEVDTGDCKIGISTTQSVPLARRTRCPGPCKGGAGLEVVDRSLGSAGGCKATTAASDRTCCPSRRGQTQICFCDHPCPERRACVASPGRSGAPFEALRDDLDLIHWRPVPHMFGFHEAGWISRNHGLCPCHVRQKM